MQILRLLLLLCLVTFSFGKVIEIDDKTDFEELLSKSSIYLDYNNTLSIKQILNNNIKFKNNNEKLLGFGYSPKFTVWVKIKLYNKSKKILHKIIEYDNALTTNITFYSSLNNYKAQNEGLEHITKDRKSINPIFKITLEPEQTATYYIKSSSYITTLIVKLNLWNNNKFYEEEIHHQVILALFFGAMSILGLYNLFIFFFTKDRSYLYYVLYIFGIMIHHLMYVGVTNVYLIPHYFLMDFITYATFIVGFPALALALFTKSFLRTIQYPILNKILNTYLIAFPFLLTIFLITDEFNKYRNIFSVILLILLVIITVYAAFRKNRQAYFVLFGWFIFLTAGMFMYLSSVGILNIFTKFPYYIEISLVLEAIIFSVALVDRIKQLQKDKEEANKKLILQQKNEQKRLREKVNEKTRDLKITLDEKGLLLKELNHRVKNNMQTIVSLIRLQSDDIEDEKLQDVLITIQNRISAMGHLHELLYMQENIVDVDAHKYFKLLIEEVRQSYSSIVNINLNIKTNLQMGQAIYCGLILNELISNSFKHAFKNKQGNIDILLDKKDKEYILIVEDDGIGYDQNKPTNSLGLILIKTLAKEQLKGNININSKNRVKVEIRWENV